MLIYHIDVIVCLDQFHVFSICLRMIIDSKVVKPAICRHIKKLSNAMFYFPLKSQKIFSKGK